MFWYVDDISGLKAMLGFQARWRYEKSREFPHDARNHLACEAFERMADEVDNGDFNEDLAKRLIELMDVADGDAESAELISEILREVGFGYAPASVDDLIGRLIRALEPAEPATA